MAMPLDSGGGKLLHPLDDQCGQPSEGSSMRSSRIGDQRAADGQHLLFAAAEEGAGDVGSLFQFREEIVDRFGRPRGVHPLWRQENSRCSSTVKEGKSIRP